MIMDSSNALKNDTDKAAGDVEKLKKPLGDLAFHLEEIRALKERVKAKLRSVKDRFPLFEAAKETGILTFFNNMRIP